MDLKKEKTLKENVVYKGKILSLQVDDVELGDGTKTKREVVVHNGGACILAEVNGRIAFVRQYRYAYKEFILELPAGKVELGENPKEAALRELSEETGLVAEEMIDYGKMYPSCGYTSEIIYLYVAKGLKQGNMHLDQGEALNVYYYTIDEIKEMLAQNKIKDAKSLCLLYKYFSRTKGE